MYYWAQDTIYSYIYVATAVELNFKFAILNLLESPLEIELH